MKQRYGFAALWIVLLVVVALAVGGTWYWETHMATQTAPVTVVESNTPTPVSSSVSTSTASAEPQKQDCGSIGWNPSTPEQKAALSCFASAVVNCTPASATQLDTKGIADGVISVLGKESTFCVLSQKVFDPKTLQTCKFPLSLMPTVQQVSKDSIASSPGTPIDQLSLAQITVTTFLGHKYTNPYTNQVTNIDCTSQ